MSLNANGCVGGFLGGRKDCFPERLAGNIHPPREHRSEKASSNKEYQYLGCSAYENSTLGPVSSISYGQFSDVNIIIIYLKEE
jgi:hypothetical protein